MPESLELKAQELQKKMEAAEQKAETAKKEAEEARKKAEEAAEKLAKAETAIEERKNEVDNLDKTVKEQQALLEKLRSEMKAKSAKTFEVALKDFMDEHREEMDAFVKGNTYGRMAFKFSTANITGTSLGIQLDQNVHADRLAANAFYTSFPKTTRTGNSIEWLDGSDTDNTGYVGEFTAPSTPNAYAVTGKTRKFAKIGSLIEVSQETTDWFNAVYQWARTRGIARILRKADELVWKGDGNDSTAANHVYGLKTSGCTAFAATGAKYDGATVADVILDAIAQAKANGFSANIVLVPTVIEAQIRGLKDKNGNYLYNQVTGMLGVVRVVTSDQLGATEILVADSSCVEIVDRGEYEMELERVAGKDGWNVWLRKALQVKVPTAEKKGVIYVANVTTALAAITPAA